MLNMLLYQDKLFVSKYIANFAIKTGPIASFDEDRGGSFVLLPIAFSFMMLSSSFVSARIPCIIYIF